MPARTRKAPHERGTAISLISAISGLLGVLIWPLLILFIVVRFRAPLADFFSHLGEFSFKAPGLEASARRQQVEAAAALGAAVVANTGADGTGAPASPTELAQAVAVADARIQQRLQGRIVLWVDDRPDNNRYERQALEAFGVRFVLSTSTEEALGQIQRQSFDLIISDMARPSDRRAGITLLDQLRAAGNKTPYIIYASARARELGQEAIRRGALGFSDSPQELLVMVSRALGTPP